MRSIAIVLVVLAACGKGDDKSKGGGEDPEAQLARYMHKASEQEAHIQLDSIGTAAQKYFYMHDNRFPSITVGPTPSQPCCKQPDHECAPNASDWLGTDWEQLRFKMTDRAFHWQYSFTGTPTSFTATAVGDAGCDGKTQTFTATGSIVSGEPVVKFSRP